MILGNQSFNKMFQTCNKELKSIVNEAIEHDDLTILNKVITTIKYFRKRTELTDNFGNELLSDIANTLKGTNFFDDNLSLLDNYKLLENQKEILLKNLVSKKYEFTNGQISNMPPKILFYTLDKYRDRTIYSEILVDEINNRIENSKLDLNNHIESIYLYLIMSNKLNKVSTLNKLIKTEKFINILDNTDIPGSIIISLTDICNRPRKMLLEKSKKIKYSITVNDELFAPADILNSLTKEEINILYKDKDIYNTIITNGIRFECLPDEVKDNIISDLNNFSMFNMDTTVELTNSYKDIEKLANNIDYLLMYLNKLDHNIYDNKIFKYINPVSISELLLKDEFYNLDDYKVIELLEELNMESFITLSNNDYVYKIINNNMNEILFKKLNKIKQIKYFENRNLDVNDIYLLSLLPKKEIVNVFNNNSSAIDALKEYIKIDSAIGIPTILENIPVNVLEEVIVSDIKYLTTNKLQQLASNNIEVIKNTIINNKYILNTLTNKGIDTLLNIIDFNENQLVKLINKGEELSSEVITSINDRISDSNKVNVFTNEILRTKIIESKKEMDSYTFNYLLNNINEISKLDEKSIIDIINYVDEKNKIKVLSNKEVMKKLFKTSFNNDNIFILKINNKEKYFKYFTETVYIKYYTKDILNKIFDCLNIETKKELCKNEKLMRHILDNNDGIYKIYESVMSKNNYLFTTLDFNIFNEEIIKMKTQYVEQIVKYKEIEQLIIDINKEHVLTSNFITYLINSLTDLDYEKYMKMMLTYIKESVYKTNRKNTSNIFNILPDKITKKDTDLLVEYLLYIKEFKVIEAPSTYDELVNYTFNTEEYLYKQIHKTNTNIRENFLKRHYKLTLRETENIISKYSISRVDKNIYKEETNFILELITILNKEEHILKEKDGKYKRISMLESIKLRNKIDSMYTTIYNYELKSKAKSGRALELSSYGRVIKASETPEDFFYLIMNESLLNRESNYLNNYVDTISSKNITYSLVSNDNLSIKNNKDLILGFNHISKINYMSKYNTPRELIDNSRDKGNVIGISKYDNKTNTKYILPDYILIYEKNINDELVDKAYRASIELGNKKPLPIIVIKEDKIIDSELNKINSLLIKYSKTKDINVLTSIIIKYNNNYSGLFISNKKLSYKFDLNALMNNIGKEVSKINSKKALKYLKDVINDENKKYHKIPYEYEEIIKIIDNKIK